MTVTVVKPDVMGDVRTALRGLIDLEPYINGVFFNTPLKASFPIIRLTEAGWQMQPGPTPVGVQRVTIEVIGGALKGGVASDYFDVTQAENIVVSWVWALTGPIGTSTFVLNGDVDTVTDSPDPDDGGPRKVISALFTVRHR